MFGWGRQRIRSAACYLRDGKLYLHSSSLAAAGFWTATPPWLVVDPADVEGLSRAIDAALAGSRARVRTPDRDTPVLAPLYELAGVKSWSRFVAGTRSVTIEQAGAVRTFTPMRNAGARGGFEGLPELAFEGRADEASGPALRRALELARAD